MTTMTPLQLYAKIMIFVRGFDVLTMLVCCPFNYSLSKAYPFYTKVSVFHVVVNVVLLPEIKEDKI